MARYITSGGMKYIGGNDAPFGFEKDVDGKYKTDPIRGIVYELEKRRRNPKDGCPDTGWYLYGNGHFGTWCATRILDAVVAANDIILSGKS